MKFNIIAMLCIHALLTGCVPPTKTEHMVVSSNNQRQAHSKFFEKLSVGNVTVNLKDDKRAESQITKQDLKAALYKSLANYSFIATSSPATYKMDAELETFEQVGFDVKISNMLDIKVKSVISYSIYEIYSGKLVFKKNIESYYTTEFNKAFAGVKRVRLANEGSIRSNFELLMQELTIPSESLRQN